jgi:hypothetical protein
LGRGVAPRADGRRRRTSAGTNGRGRRWRRHAVDSSVAIGLRADEGLELLVVGAALVLLVVGVGRGGAPRALSLVEDLGDVAAPLGNLPTQT